MQMNVIRSDAVNKSEPMKTSLIFKTIVYGINRFLIKKKSIKLAFCFIHFYLSSVYAICSKQFRFFPLLLSYSFVFFLFLSQFVWLGWVVASVILCSNTQFQVGSWLSWVLDSYSVDFLFTGTVQVVAHFFVARFRLFEMDWVIQCKIRRNSSTWR